MHKRGVFRGFRSKKGVEHALWTIIEIVLLMLILVSMFAFIRSVKENRFFERSALSKDTALLMDTLQSLPGDVFYTYHHQGFDTTRYTFSFNKDEVVVKDSDSILNNRYPYYDDDNLINLYPGPIEQPKQLQFKKSQGEMKIAEELEQTFGRQKCGKAEKSLAKTSIVHIIYKEHELKQAADALQGYLQLAGFTTTYITHISDITGNEDSLKSNDLIITLSLGSDEDAARLPLIARYSNTESSKLACYIANSYLDTAGWVTDTTAEQDKGNPLLPEEKLSVVLEIGNKNALDFDIRQNADSTARSISTGIKEYEGSKHET
jgi:hypothetical protein